MKISHVTTRILSTPADNPLIVGLPPRGDTREFVTLELGTDAGLVGLGLTFFGGALTPALKAAVERLGELVVGEDPTRTEAIAAKLRAAAGTSGPGGFSPWRCRRSISPAGTSKAKLRANPCASCWAVCGIVCRRTRAAHYCVSIRWSI